MSIALSTIGVKVSYAVESEIGVRPETGYIHLPDFKSTPDFNPQPNTIESTTFDNLEFTSYISGLKDLGGALQFTVNFTQTLIDKWNGTGGVLDKYDIAKAAGKSMYFCVDIPGFSESIYFAGEPSKMGLPEMSQNSLLESTVFISPIGEPVWGTDPIYDSETSYTVTFTVNDSVPEGVSGATITIINKNTKTTNTSGIATFSLLPGDYVYKVSKTGITTQYGGVTVTNENVSVEISDFQA